MLLTHCSKYQFGCLLFCCQKCLYHRRKNKNLVQRSSSRVHAYQTQHSLVIVKKECSQCLFMFKVSVSVCQRDGICNWKLLFFFFYEVVQLWSVCLNYDLCVLVPVLQLIQGFILYIPERVCQWANTGKTFLTAFLTKETFNCF